MISNTHVDTDTNYYFPDYALAPGSIYNRLAGKVERNNEVRTLLGERNNDWRRTSVAGAAKAAEKEITAVGKNVPQLRDDRINFCRDLRRSQRRQARIHRQTDQEYKTQGKQSSRQMVQIDCIFPIEITEEWNRIVLNE